MDIIRFLREQHDDVEDVLNQIIVRRDASELRSLLATMSKALRLHMKIEETIVYPAARQSFQGDPTKPSVLQSFEEHELARQCLSVLESTQPTDEHFVARAKVLKSVLREHILEEEIELFPSLETKLHQSGIDRLGQEVERQMSRLEAEIAPRPATPAESESPAAKSPVAEAAPKRASAPKSRSAKVARTKHPRAATAAGKRSRGQASTRRSARHR